MTNKKGEKKTRNIWDDKEFVFFPSLVGKRVALALNTPCWCGGSQRSQENLFFFFSSFHSRALKFNVPIFCSIFDRGSLKTASSKVVCVVVKKPATSSVLWYKPSFWSVEEQRLGRDENYNQIFWCIIKVFLRRPTTNDHNDWSTIVRLAWRSNGLASAAIQSSELTNRAKKNYDHSSSHC